MNLHVCSFSTGLSSAIMTERVLLKHGGDNVKVVFMDTSIEHDDNYRFMRDVSRRWVELYGVGIRSLKEGRSPYEVADDNGIIMNQRVAPCTRILKIEPFMKWIADFPDAVVCIGIGFDEVHRCESITRNYARAGYHVEFPLLWRPIEHRPFAQVVQQDWGIEPPITYAMGFQHANCLGHDSKGRGGCVKAGKADRIRQYINMPEVARTTAQWELSNPGYTKHGYTMLRDQTGGDVGPRTLQSVIDEYDQSQEIQPSLFDAGCVHCGIGDFVS